MAVVISDVDTDTDIKQWFYFVKYICKNSSSDAPIRDFADVPKTD